MRKEQTTNNEIWKPVLRYEGVYEVSDMGRVRRIGKAKSVSVGRVLKPILTRGYGLVNLSVNSKTHWFTVHELVAEAFIGPRPEGLEIDHINGNKLDNSKDNLRYVTRKENVRHARKLRTPQWRSKKLTTEEVHEIRKLKKEGVTNETLAFLFKCNYTTVWNVVKGRTYRNI